MRHAATGARDAANCAQLPHAIDFHACDRILVLALLQDIHDTGSAVFVEKLRRFLDVCREGAAQGREWGALQEGGSGLMASMAARHA